MHWPAYLRPLLFLAAIGWSGIQLFEALQRWSFARICVKTCGPYWPAELVGQLRAEMDWQSPLVLATVPLLLGAVAWLWRRLRPSMSGRPPDAAPGSG
jgi:hypothetical protein